MPEKSYPMTAEGKEKLEAELKNLKLVKRPKVIKRIKIARSYGDLSENSEYDSAKDEQSHVEDRIDVVEQMLKYAHVVDADSVDPNEVSVGKKVTYTEVGEDDP
ncbi:transcription elongation factor GreA, partial [Lactobacillus acetotolerans]